MTITTEDRLREILHLLLGPDATFDDARELDAALGGVHPSQLPPETFQWLREGEGPAPSASTLLGIYNDLSDSRKADLVECAKVIAMAP